jgi:hypothetical protein
MEIDGSDRRVRIAQNRRQGRMRFRFETPPNEESRPEAALYSLLTFDLGTAYANNLVKALACTISRGWLRWL